MDLKARIVGQLGFVRGLTERILSDFKSPDDFVYQVDPNTNHVLWLAGHLGVVENFMIRQFDPTKAVETAGYRDQFGIGSRPIGDLSAYPPVEEVLAFMRERRAALLALVAPLGDADLLRPCPPGAPAFMTDLASVLEAAVWHEAMHTGQMTVVRRALGHPPIVDRPPPT
jgi:hypothetical protein